MWLGEPKCWLPRACAAGALGAFTFHMVGIRLEQVPLLKAAQSAGFQGPVPRHRQEASNMRNGRPLHGDVLLCELASQTGAVPAGAGMAGLLVQQRRRRPGRRWCAPCRGHRCMPLPVCPLLNMRVSFGDVLLWALQSLCKAYGAPCTSAISSQLGQPSSTDHMGPSSCCSAAPVRPLVACALTSFLQIAWATGMRSRRPRPCSRRMGCWAPSPPLPNQALPAARPNAARPAAAPAPPPGS